MKYYKILKDNTFIGAACSSHFVKYQRKHQFLENTNEEHGEFLLYNGVLYRTTWMQPLPDAQYSYVDADIVEIDEELYTQLAEAIATNKEIAIDTNPPMTYPETVEDEDDAIVLEYMRASKIQEMSYECNKAIESGIDFNNQHYSLTQYDQINLLSAQFELLSGALNVSYHADDEPYRAYDVAEISAIIDLANQHKASNLQKFNELKARINTLTTINDIATIQWSDVHE